LLDKLKVQPEVFRREEYKAALAPLMGTGFDAAHRENVTSLLKVRRHAGWDGTRRLSDMHRGMPCDRLWRMLQSVCFYNQVV
jgi:hypothetical protein